MIKQETHFAVQVEEVKCEETHANLDVLDFDILPLPPAQLLEGHQLASCTVNSNSFSIEHE